MCVPRHEVVPLPVSALDHDPDERYQGCFYLANLFDQPEAHIGRDLIVPRPAGVQFPSQRPYQLAQAALVSCVNVFIIRLNLKLLVDQQSEGRGEEDRENNLACLPFSPNSDETLDYPLLLVFGQDTNEGQCFGICDRAANVCVVHPLVVFQ